jgi:NAD(P) transhydrogenase subunit beta
MMNKTKEARSGNLVSSVGMLIAIIATLLQINIVSITEILACMAIGSAIGLYYAYKVEMTKIPEMVSLFNGFGGLASVAVAVSDFWLKTNVTMVQMGIIITISIVLSVFIGAITFTGSMVAFLKLNGKVTGNPITFKGQHLINLI